MGPDRGNMGGVPKLQCSFLQETDKYSELCELERYRDGAPMHWLPKGSTSSTLRLCQWKAPHKSFLQSVNNLHAPVVSHGRCCYQSCLSPACQTFDHPYILLDPLGIVCAI